MKTTVWEHRERATEEDQQIARLTRRETPDARRRRIARRAVNPETVAALRRLWAA